MIIIIIISVLIISQSEKDTLHCLYDAAFLQSRVKHVITWLVLLSHPVSRPLVPVSEYNTRRDIKQVTRNSHGVHLPVSTHYPITSHVTKQVQNVCLESASWTGHVYIISFNIYTDQLMNANANDGSLCITGFDGVDMGYPDEVIGYSVLLKTLSSTDRSVRTLQHKQVNRYSCNSKISIKWCYYCSSSGCSSGGSSSRSSSSDKRLAYNIQSDCHKTVTPDTMQSTTVPLQSTALSIYVHMHILDSM